MRHAFLLFYGNNFSTYCSLAYGMRFNFVCMTDWQCKFEFRNGQIRSSVIVHLLDDCPWLDLDLGIEGCVILEGYNVLVNIAGD